MVDEVTPNEYTKRLWLYLRPTSYGNPWWDEAVTLCMESSKDDARRLIRDMWKGKMTYIITHMAPGPFQDFIFVAFDKIEWDWIVDQVEKTVLRMKALEDRRRK